MTVTPRDLVLYVNQLSENSELKVIMQSTAYGRTNNLLIENSTVLKRL